MFLVDKCAETARTRDIEALQPLVNGVENGHLRDMRPDSTALAFALAALLFPSTGFAEEAPVVEAPVPPADSPEEAPTGLEGPESGAAQVEEEREPEAPASSSTSSETPGGPVEGTAAVSSEPVGAAPPAPAEPAVPAEPVAPVVEEDTSQEFPYDKRRNTPQGTTRPISDDDDAPKEDAEKKTLDADRADFTYKALRLSAGAGYALRLSADERSHGGVGVLSVGLPIFYGFGIAAEGLVMGWGPSEKRTAPLAFGGGSALVTYVFDDTASTAILGAGPLVGYALELEESGALTTGLHAGAVFTFGLRFAVAPTTTAEIGIRAPFMIYGPEGVVLRMPLMQTETDTPGLFESQFLLTFGLTFDPFMFFDLFSQGRDPLPLIVPFLSAAQDG